MENMIGIDSLFTSYVCMASETRQIDTRINISLRIQYEDQVLLEDLEEFIVDQSILASA